MKNRHMIVLIAITLLVFGTAFSVRADKVRSLEERFYTSHEGHSHLGSIDIDSGAGTDVGPYAHPDLAIDRWNWPAVNGALYGNHFYTILNRRVPLGEDPPQPEARLARVNVRTGKVKLLGSPIDRNLGGMEISYCGEVYATGFSLVNALGGFYGDTNLYRVDRKDGSLTLIGDTGIERIMDLAFDPQGTLWATVGNVLYTLDMETGAPTGVATITGAETEIMGIAFTSEGELYATTPWADTFYRIDPESGVATAVGNTGFSIAHGGDIPMIPEDTRCP
jgi:hypothetical protein